jgi:DNA polymerase III subunit gamma/tau
MDNNYQVYARKWRPQNFDEIIGQEQVTIPLKKAIELKRIMQAYLFSGSRGVGKTTAARVFAKALNCETGPTPEPCGKCASCEEIKNGSALDVIEIDGASNRGIDEIRKLREYVSVGAARSRYKVYIIDEVHMLTNEAFNALLKTLEEPPKHVIFIFATTDPQKMPATILSRCQHFRFKRMPVALTVGNLKMIAAKEKIEAEEEALFIIAKASDGALRDAQKVFDQLVTFAGGEKITAELAGSMLGEIGDERTNTLIELIIKRDLNNAVAAVNSIFEKGYEIRPVIRNLVEGFRNLLVIKTTGAKDTVEASVDELKFLLEMARGTDRERLLYILQKCIEAEITVKNTQMPNILLETMVIDLCMDKVSVPSLQQNETTAPAQGGVTPKTQSPAVLQSAEKEPAKAAPPQAVAKEEVLYDPQEDAFASGPQEGAASPSIMIDEITEDEEVKNLTADIIKKRWENVIERARTQKIEDEVAQALASVHIVSFEAGVLSLIGENPFFTEQVKNAADAVKKYLKDEFKQDIKVSVFDKAEYDKRSKLKKEVTEEDAMNNETVKSLEKVFGKFTEVKVIKHHKQ